MIGGIIDLPATKSTFIYEDIADVLVTLVTDAKLEQAVLRVLKVLFDIKIGLGADDLKTRLVEDMPTISQTQNLLLECRKFLNFALPEGIRKDEDENLDKDDLFDEFENNNSDYEGCNVDSTILAL